MKLLYSWGMQVTSVTSVYEQKFRLKDKSFRWFRCHCECCHGTLTGTKNFVLEWSSMRFLLVRQSIHLTLNRNSKENALCILYYVLNLLKHLNFALTFTCVPGATLPLSHYCWQQSMNHRVNKPTIFRSQSEFTNRYIYHIKIQAYA